MLLITEEDLTLSEESIDGYLRSQDILLSPEELHCLRQKSEGNPFDLMSAMATISKLFKTTLDTQLFLSPWMSTDTSQSR